ncbi:MAG: shikimate dehydrogenase [Oscillospiraceae bacterium]|nr:shikimate dehydrogenase [Oscillospiraceae bacterium]
MITAKTLQLGIIGDPVDHSFSPKMQNFIANHMGMDYVYSAFHVKPENVGDAIRGIRALGIRGINVTAPHKVAVMQYLDEISPQAEILGSVNTIVNRGGKLIGYNTDSEGFYLALTNAGIKIEGSKILVMGAGGVVKPTLIRLAQAKPERITIVNRTPQRAKDVADGVFAATGYKICTEITDFDFDIVLNTTSAGMEPQLDALPCDSIREIDNFDFIRPGISAVDMIYNPDRTRFLKLAQERGAKILNGLDMLIYQGIIAYELFTDTKLPDGIAGVIRKEVFGR